jgi:Matrixin
MAIQVKTKSDLDRKQKLVSYADYDDQYQLTIEDYDEFKSSLITSKNTFEKNVYVPKKYILDIDTNQYSDFWTLKNSESVKNRQKGFSDLGVLTSNDQFLRISDRQPVIKSDSLYAPGAPITEPETFLASGTKWSQPGGKNTRTTITYSYSNLLNGALKGGITNAQITGAIKEAVGLWSLYAPLKFIELLDSGPAPSDTSYAAGTNPQIRFGVHAIDGLNGVLAHAYYPYSTTDGLAGDIHFDSAETWKTSPSTGAFDLLEVAVHELGHALGLDHETKQTAILNPTYGGRYSGLGSAFLLQDDISGIQDIYGQYSLGFQRWATNQGGFWDAQKWLSGDFNGDGKADTAKVFGGALANIDVHLSNGSSFGIQRWATDQGGFWSAQKWLTGDFNGDGKTDLTKIFGSTLANIDVHLSNGSSFGIQRWATDQGGFWDAQKWLAGDFNGDGKTDLAKVFGGALANIDVHLSNGSSFGIQRWATDRGGFSDAQKWLAGDFNGDGKADLANIFNGGDGLAYIDVHLSTGNGFSTQRWANAQGGFWDAQKWLVADFNGDGKADLANVFGGSTANVDVHLSSGSSFGIQRWATDQGGFSNSQQWLAGDFNGDGTADLAKSFNTGGLASIDVHKLL